MEQSVCFGKVIIYQEKGGLNQENQNICFKSERISKYSERKKWRRKMKNDGKELLRSGF